jgi:hypothetical protein
VTQYEQCPKCAHAPLPADQSLPAACPACGIVFAKFAQATAPRDESDDASARIGAKPDASFADKARTLLFHIPERVDPIVLWSRALLLAVFAVWGLRLIAMDYRTGELGESFLHGPLLIFHEAGHVIFSPFGEFVTIFGGTLAQLLLPAIMVGAFLWRKRDPFGAAIATWLFGVSLLDVAPYIYDALNPRLILLGGHTGAEGGHDWIYLLSELGLRNSAHGLGSLTHKVGALIVLLALVWGGWILAQRKKRLAVGG